MSKIRLSSSLQLDSLVDGEGLRMVLWCQGCDLNCPGCHNPETHDIYGGKEYEIEEIKKQLYKNKDKYNGLTLSGGHPFLQIDACSEIADYCHEIGLNVWIYTGYTYEHIIKDKKLTKLLRKCDILVDGAFVLDLRTVTLPFRGSSNQRIIDIQKSLKNNKVILYKI